MLEELAVLLEVPLIGGEVGFGCLYGSVRLFQSRLKIRVLQLHQHVALLDRIRSVDVNGLDPRQQPRADDCLLDWLDGPDGRGDLIYRLALDQQHFAVANGLHCRRDAAGLEFVLKRPP